ncbi:MAG: hypothetical protein Q7T76_04745 [Ferruginibacter sp.]|nr:hypothetical protein [Ferruginibacter sp.]
MKTCRPLTVLLFSFIPPARSGSMPGKKLTLFLLMICVISMSSCFLHYYKTNTEQKKDAAKFQELISGRKYFILHSAARPRALKEVSLNNGIIEAEVTALDAEHTKYLRPLNFEKNRFKKAENDVVLREVHMYTHDSIATQGKVRVPFNSFYRMDVYEQNEQATRHSQIASTIGIVLTTAGVVALAVGINDVNNWGESEGCSPQLYLVNDSGKSLTGILYSGAIFAPLQRTDYLPLHGLEKHPGDVHLQLRGGRNEELFVDNANLLKVTHPGGYKVLVDKKGQVLSYKSPVASHTAFISTEEDMSSALAKKDNLFYSFTNAANKAGASDVILNFKKPAGVSTGKLIVAAKNSTWAGHLFRKFKSFYGEDYGRVVERKDKADPKKLLQCEIDQSLPLSVSIKVGDKWKAVDFFHTPGNEALRVMIMEIDLAEVADEEYVQVKLETTYMFWDLDYAAVDFSTAIPITTQYASNKKLTRVNTGTQLPEVSQEENIRVSEEEYLDISFKIPATAGDGQASSYFVVGSGYYHDNTKYAGKAQLAKLARFSRKGAFDKFSRENFTELSAMLKMKTGQTLAAKK